MKNLILAKLTTGIFEELRNTLADVQTAHFKGRCEDLKVQLRYFFEFARECLQANLVKGIQITILFEQAFTTASVAEVERILDLFSNFVNVNGLYQQETGRSDSEKESNELILFRMFEHSILSKLQTLKDTRLKAKANALLASLVRFNHSGGLNVLGKFNDRRDRPLEEVMTKEQAESCLA